MKSTIHLFLFLLAGFSHVTVCQEMTDMQDTLIAEQTVAVLPSKSGFDFFASDAPLEITLRFDIREFLKTKNKQEYQDALMTIRISESDSISQAIKLRSRGFMRLSYCSFPPIMLKFNRDEENKPIQAKGTLKLVTHCTKSAVFERYVFKEYLTYKLYNLVTPYSFRTRLVKITYQDSGKSAEAFTEYGFLIENEEQMAARNNAVVINTTNISQKNMNATDMARVAVFNYMIGNTDWSVPYQHNIKVLKSLSGVSDTGIPVAYDFDYSALVNTMYSAPPEQLPIKSVMERYYMGLCFEDEKIKPVLDEFSGMQEELMGVIHDFEYLSKAEKKQVELYIKGFYSMYRNQNILISDLNRTCKQY